MIASLKLQVALTDSKVERMRKAVKGQLEGQFCKQKQILKFWQSVTCFAIRSAIFHASHSPTPAFFTIWFFFPGMCQKKVYLLDSVLSSRGTIFATDPGSNATLVRQSGARFWHLGKRKEIQGFWVLWSSCETPRLWKTREKLKGNICVALQFITRSRQQITRFPNRQHEYQPWTQLNLDCGFYHDSWHHRFITPAYSIIDL